MEPYRPKQFDPSGLTGISDRTLEMHFKLYEGYVAETNRLNEKIGAVTFKIFRLRPPGLECSSPSRVRITRTNRGRGRHDLELAFRPWQARHPGGKLRGAVKVINTAARKG